MFNVLALMPSTVNGIALAVRTGGDACWDEPEPEPLVDTVAQPVPWSGDYAFQVREGIIDDDEE